MQDSIENIIAEKFPMLFEEELKQEIIQKGILKEVEAGTLLMSTGGFITSIPLIINGRLKVYREDSEEGEIFLYYLGSGEVCAMSLLCCIQHEESNVKAVAEDDSTILFIGIENMDEWMTKYNGWRKFVIDSYKNRLSDLLNFIDDISFKGMDYRLLSYLKRRSESENTNVLNIMHKEIADDLNSSREVISRLLKQLEKTNKIKLSRNKIEIISLV